MFRRLASALAASAVVLSGLVWGSAPASAVGEAFSSMSPTSGGVGSTAIFTFDITLQVNNTSGGSNVEGGYYLLLPGFNYSGLSCSNVSFSPALSAGADVGLEGGCLGFVAGRGLNFSSSYISGETTRSYTATITNLVAPSVAGEYTVGLANWNASVIFATQTFTAIAPPDAFLVTIDIDGNGGTCSTEKVTGYSTTWATAPGARDCRRAGFTFTGFNTSADGSGTAIAPGGSLQLTGDNRIYAQYVAPRTAAAPTDVVATPGLKKVTVTWKAPSDTGTSPINGYLVQAYPGFNTCVTNLASTNMLECTYTNLVPGTKYSFAVQALNGAGWSNFSAGSNLTSPYDLMLDSLSRPEVKVLFISRGSNLEAAGRAPGLEAGTVLTPMLQVGTDGAFVPQTGNTAKVNADGEFTWSKRLDRSTNKRPASLYFTYADSTTTTLTAGLGARVGLPTAPRDVKVKSGTAGFTVSWQPPANDGGSPITEYVMKSDLRAPSWAQSKFVTCTVKAPTTTCTMPGSSTVFDSNKEYTFSVVAKTERGTSPQASRKWKGELYRLNIFKRARVDSEVLLSFSAVGWPKDARGFEIQAKVGQNGEWKKQGTARLDPDYVEPIGDWIGMLPRSVTPGSEVFYRVKSDKGFSNEVRFRLSSSFEYSFG